MKRGLAYIWWMVLAAMLATSCNSGKRLNPRITLWRGDKIPYGAWYFYEHLNRLFPSADIVVDKESPDQRGHFSPRLNEIVTQMYQHRQRTASIMLARTIQPDEAELKAMIEFASSGNYLFLSAFDFSTGLLDSLGLKLDTLRPFVSVGDSLTVSIANPESGERESFSYPGFSIDSYFGQVDSIYDSELGWNENGKANFVRVKYQSGGAIFIHMAPMAFTNFFLLHKNNKRYYDYALSYLPKGIELVAWNEYFRTHQRGDDQQGSGQALGWIMKQPALAAAAWLLLLLMILVFLFESKRRQRLLDEIPPLKNASMDFVQTIGRLYYDRRDNRNLAEKMSAHFLEQVRNRYKMSTSRLDDEFENRLAFKTGFDREALHQLLYRVKHLPQMPQVSDEELLEFSRELDKFFKQT